MQFAEVDGIRRMAEPTLKGVCGHCGGAVQAKCGSKVVWHWAHLAIDSCDSWYEPETEWHRNWKSHFGMERSEISIIKEGVKHIADVLTANELVIEFQNSPISSETIAAREEFYDRMIWVINGAAFKEQFQVWDKEFAENWDVPIEVVNDADGRRLLHIRADQLKQPGIKGILTKLKFVFDPQYSVYSYDFSKLQNSHALEARVRAGILELYRQNKTEQKLKPVLFNWQHARRSWQNAKKPVFIDFGDDHLVWIKTNMGTGKGEAAKVLKKDFLEKYAGLK